MNSVNASTGYSGFQLHLSHSPQIIPLIIQPNLPTELLNASETASAIIQQLQTDVADTKDNLLLAKITQGHHAVASRGPEPIYSVNDMVMLSTTNRRHKYKTKGDK
jgi:hypothetical protein